MNEVFDLIVVGGGAAGFFAALAAAQKKPDLKIVILERGAKPLAKVLISGGGRCNVTHACFDPEKLITFYPRGARELRGPFTRFQPADTVSWFEDCGVPLKTEADGRVFPVSNQSQTIVDCLLNQANGLGIKVWERCSVRSIGFESGDFVVLGSGFEPLKAKKVLLAPGGNAAPIYESAIALGHSIIPPVPSLFTFNIKDPRIQNLPGIAVDPCHLSLESGGRKFDADGPLLITHWGMSGPAVLKLSAWAARELEAASYKAQLAVNWLPAFGFDYVYKRLLKLKDEKPRSKLIRQDPFGKLPARLWQSLARAAGSPEDRTLAETGNKVLRRLAEELTQGKYIVNGKGVFKEEFVTCGGIALNEVDFNTMESRLQPGLYFAGEVLDIDGLTGGFNFQSAWTTGWLAGKGISSQF